jgi:hypothetical protein
MNERGRASGNTRERQSARTLRRRKIFEILTDDQVRRIS